jgi:hypothetical protein
MVSTELPEVVTVVGEKLPEAPLGSPATARDTAPVNPFRAAIVVVSLVAPPAVTCRELALSVSVKFGCVPAATVKVTVAVCDVLPEVPVMVSV